MGKRKHFLLGIIFWLALPILVFAGGMDTPGGVVEFDAESFSVYGVVYTIQYGEYSYELLGNLEVNLSELLDILETGISIDEVEEVVSSNEAVLKVSEESGEKDWLIKLLGEEIDTEKEELEIPVEEAASLTVSTISGKSIIISLSPTGLKELDLDGTVIKAADGLYLPLEAEGHSFIQEDDEETIKAVEEYVSITSSTDQPEEEETLSTAETGEEIDEEKSSSDSETVEEIDEEEAPSSVETEEVDEQNTQTEETFDEEFEESSNRSYLVYEIGLENVDIGAYENGFEVSINLPTDVHGKDFKLYHIHDDEINEVEDLVIEDGSLSFMTDSFSEFILSYTVDFHWLVDGQDFVFSIPGGGFVSFKNLIQILGIVEEDKADSFIDDVENVCFSSPDLVWVGKIEEDVTVAQLKEKNVLSCEYSSDLTEEEIQEINESIVKAVDWALISLKAFDSDEKLTIYMKNGQSWTIRVSDEQTDYRVLVNDSSIGYFTNAGSRDIFARGSNNTYLYVTDVETNNGQVVHYNHISEQNNASVTAVPRENYDFAFWLILNPDGTINTHKSATLSTSNIAIGATHIAFFTPKNSKVIVRGEAEPNTAWHYTPNGIRYVYDRTNLPRYCYTADRLQFQSGIDDSGTRNKYEFIGWYNLDDYLSTGYDVYDNNTGYYKHYFDTYTVTDHTVLIPRYELKEDYRNYYNVWLDASNGVTGANLDNKGTSTFYSRLNRYGAIEGAKTYHYEVQKGNTLYLPSNVANNEQPLGNQSYQVNYNIKGWYDIYSGTYYTPNQNIPITSDTVLYADWFPNNYNIGLPHDTVPSTDTSSFITTHVFDYNNLFNMDSIYLHEDSFVNKVKNYERWDMKTNGLDFVFMSAVSGSGRSLNPAGRTYNNQSHEYGTNGNYYTGVVSPGILNATLQDKLFGITSGQQLGKRYVGKGNFLYTYDDTNGYYYFDSDRNAASYNATADGGRFYLYNYTNKTDKSVGGDNTDFVPFNYGNFYSGTSDGFREAYGEVNYWFGMSSEINFYIPNSTDYRDDSGKTGNRSVKGDEMVYKFAGDDDVWIFVDGELYLDLGGVHGKVYGEINFSNGTITVAQKGALREQTNGIINYKAGDYSYKDGGIEKISYAADQVQTKTFSLAEGDHTLTLYYLERGASQSNCAIYFNLAPRYTLQLNKKDENNTTPIQNAVFEIYTDEACMTPARLWVGSDDTVRGNRFATDANGTLKVNGLVAGHDYFIKEVQPPAGYPNISEEVVKLHIDSEGNATVTSTANDIFEESVTAGQDGPFSISLNLKNKKTTSITAKKTWKSLDGKEPDMSIVTDITVQLKRYHLVKESSGTAQKRNVNVHVMYYAFSEYNSTPVASDRGYLTYLQTKTYEAYEGGSISFTATTTNSNAIRGIRTQTNSEHTENYDSYGSAYYYVDYSWYRLPQKVDVTITDIDGDIDYYIMLVSYESKDRVTITLPDSPSSVTNPGTGTTTRKEYDDTFTGYTANLSDSNNWQNTWKNLQTGSAESPWYYEVVETDVNGSLPVESPWGVKTFLTTTSSDGLTAGTISVHNTMNALKVKIRKVDTEKDEEGEYADLSGAEFQMYTDTEYEKTPRGEPVTFNETNKGFLDTDTLREDGKTFVSSTDGWIYKGFLPAGTYYFVETKAPDGYTLLVNPIKVQISGAGLKYYDFGTGEWKTEPTDNDGYYNHIIENTAGAVLPATGGKGTMVFYMMGLGLVLSSMVCLLLGKKKTAA